MYRSADGNQLVISSQDGYCSIVQFSGNELGTVMQINDPNYPVNMKDKCGFITFPPRESNSYKKRKVEQVNDTTSTTTTVRQSGNIGNAASTSATAKGDSSYFNY